MLRRQTERLVEIGVVGRPHGVRGEVRVFLHNPDSEILHNTPRLLVEIGDAEPRSYDIVNARPAGKHLAVAFDGVDSRAAADRLKGARLLLPRDQLPRLETDEFYVDDLIGLEVVCENRVLGTVRSSREQGGVEVIAVEAGDEEIEIPLVEQFVVAVRVDQGRIEVLDVDQLPRTKLSGDRKRRDG